MVLTEKRMQASEGWLIRREGTPEEKEKDFLEAINRLSRVPLKADQVHVRSMYLCSDRLCEQDWAKFSLGALEQVAKRIVGQSVIVGHDRSRLPIARFFDAEVVARPDESGRESAEAHWVKAWFYWLRETSGSKDLLLNIDGGIYREVSLSWRYRSARCSVCQGQIRECPHVPGRLYNGHRCIFEIEDVQEVLEGSIVYKGAEKSTRFEGLQERSFRVESGGEAEAGDWKISGGDLRRAGLGFCAIPRGIRSVLVVSDKPEETWAALWLIRQAGLKAGLCLPDEGDGELPLPGGFDRVYSADDDALQEGWDGLWIRSGRVEYLEKCFPALKRVSRKVRAALWPPEDRMESESGRLERCLHPHPAWQMKAMEPGKEEGARLYIREES